MSRCPFELRWFWCCPISPRFLRGSSFSGFRHHYSHLVQTIRASHSNRRLDQLQWCCPDYWCSVNVWNWPCKTYRSDQLESHVSSVWWWNNCCWYCIYYADATRARISLVFDRSRESHCNSEARHRQVEQRRVEFQEVADVRGFQGSQGVSLLSLCFLWHHGRACP
jgi:hypothetical protein